VIRHFSQITTLPLLLGAWTHSMSTTLEIRSKSPTAEAIWRDPCDLSNSLKLGHQIPLQGLLLRYKYIHGRIISFGVRWWRIEYALDCQLQR
jgi:hypothetical protein